MKTHYALPFAAAVVSLSFVMAALAQTTGVPSSTGTSNAATVPVPATPAPAIALTAQSAEELFRQMDTNQNGSLSREEFTRAWNLLQAARTSAGPSGGTVGTSSGPANR